MQLGSIQLRGLKVSLSLLWYDLWVGVYVARKLNGTVLYVCPLPCCVLQIERVGQGSDEIKARFQAALKRKMAEERIAQAQQDERNKKNRERYAGLYYDTAYPDMHNEEDEEHA